MTQPPVRETPGEALARLYDLDLHDGPGDLDLWLALAARTGSPILELMAGSGRLALPLAQAGHRLTAVDIDPAMLARARARIGGEDGATARRVRLVTADVGDLRLPAAGMFRLAFVALNSLLLLPTRAAQAGCWATLAEHLAPGGMAAVDVWLPDAADLARYDGRLHLEYVRTDPETGRLVTKTAAAQHDAATQSVALTTIYEEGAPGEAPLRWVRRDVVRLAGADELRSMAEAAGLLVEMIAGGYDLEPIGPQDERAIVLARKPGSAAPGRRSGRAAGSAG